jgi:hypothetical protein
MIGGIPEVVNNYISAGFKEISPSTDHQYRYVTSFYWNSKGHIGD